jgi:hypothetical protein
LHLFFILNAKVCTTEKIEIKLTVSGLAKVAILPLNFHTKHQSSNLAKTVIRSTKPPLLPNPCYALVPFSSVCPLFMFGQEVVRGLSGSFAFFDWLCELAKSKCATKWVAILVVSIGLKGLLS